MGEALIARIGGGKPEGQYVWKKYTVVDSAKGDFITYVADDNVTKYPDDGVQGGYYYEKVDMSKALITYNYTGASSVEFFDNYYTVKFLTSGVLTIFADNASKHDIFLVGGGGSGGNTQSEAGSSGGTSNIFSYNALGGSHGGDGYDNSGAGGAGGSGGGAGGAQAYIKSGDKYQDPGTVGGSDGSNGCAPAIEGRIAGTPGIGQGTTTRAFGEPDGELYSGGGGGGGGIYYRSDTSTQPMIYDTGGLGGAGGGGRGGGYNVSTTISPTAGLTNTGGGGGGAFSGKGNSINAGGGGGGGYTSSYLDIPDITLNTNIPVTIGAGGTAYLYGYAKNGGSGIVILRGRKE